MIINIRGTSGSGKSTLVRQVMDLFTAKEAVHVDDRLRPLYYRMGEPGLSVLGHYETPCGGCDTIPSLDRIYELVRERHAAGDDVLYEGLLISAEVNRAVQLHTDGLPLLIIGMDVPVEVCLASVNGRRRAKRGEDAPGVNPRNTEAKHKQTARAMQRFQDAGVRAQWCTREAGLQLLCSELRLL